MPVRIDGATLDHGHFDERFLVRSRFGAAEPAAEVISQQADIAMPCVGEQLDGGGAAGPFIGQHRSRASLDRHHLASRRRVAQLGGPAPYWTSYTYDIIGNRTSVTRHATGGDSSDTYDYPAPGPLAVRPHAVTDVSHTGDATGTDTYGYNDAASSTTRPGGQSPQRRAPVHDHDRCQFITVDPFLDPSSPQQTNGYSYANNSPITMSDPSGLEPRLPGRCFSYDATCNNPIAGTEAKPGKLGSDQCVDYA
jgi:hypothetical protein